MKHTLDDLIALRRELHKTPELSGQEVNTAARITQWLAANTSAIVTDKVGGTGVIGLFDSKQQGPTIVFRCELDALPIVETGTPPWRSTIDGKGHLCGHDGHMAIICGLARHLTHNPPAKGRVVVLFQPAEETGKGARAIIDDPRFVALKPDFAFALHNLPGMARHQIGVKHGPFNFASEGLAIHLSGRTSHASHPEDGISPAPTVANLIQALPALPGTLGFDTTSALITLVHASLGERAFGVAPANGLVMATLRSINNEVQDQIMGEAKALAHRLATEQGLAIDFSHDERFAACTNDPQAVGHILEAAKTLDIKIHDLQKPFRWSEDFGLLSTICPSALFVLGAGEDHPQLHNPDYDFPDELIESGLRIFAQIAAQLCGDTPCAQRK